MIERKVSNPLALAVLALLRERSMHTYEMGSMLKARAKHESIRLNYGSLYTVVDALVREGLIVALDVEREGRRPERTVYGLTPSGADELVDWLSDLLRLPVKEYPEFAAGLSLIMVLPPADAVAVLRERVEVLEDELRASPTEVLDGAGDPLPRLVLIEAEYARAIQEAELAFVRSLIHDIEEGTIDGIDLWRAHHDGSATHGYLTEATGGADSMS
jgi:DNA-binding PadR family transcriptional regulator